MEKTLLIIGGPNGCGKSSLYEALRTRKSQLPFLNADLIAVASSGLSGVASEIEAGRIFLDQLSAKLEGNESVAFESTLSGRLWLRVIEKARERSFKVVIVFVTLESIELSKERIRMRVTEGGHNIPMETVQRRWVRTHSNFWNLYRHVCDVWYLFDNSKRGATLCAHGSADDVLVYNQEVIERFMELLNVES